MATSVQDILRMYRSFNNNKFQLIEKTRNYTNENSKLYKETDGLSYDPEVFFENLKKKKPTEETDTANLKNNEYGIGSNDEKEYDEISAKYKLPISLALLNVPSEKTRREELEKLDSSRLDNIKESFEKYQKKFFVYHKIHARLVKSDLPDKFLDSNPDLRNFYDGKNLKATNLSSTEIETSPVLNDTTALEVILEEEEKARTDIKTTFDSIPEKYKTKEIKDFFKADGKLKKNNTIPSDKILEKINEVKNKNLDTINTINDNTFKAPVGYGTVKETNPDFKDLSNGMNNSSWMRASTAMNDTTAVTYKDSARHPDWALEKEKQKFKWKETKVTSSIFGENILTDSIDGILSLGRNLIRRTVIHPIKKEYKHKKNEAQELARFAKKHFPELYNDQTNLSDRQRGILYINPTSVYVSSLKIHKFYTGIIREKYNSPEKINELFIKLQRDHVGKLNSDEAKKDFKTLAFIADAYLGESVADTILRKKFMGVSLSHLDWALQGQKYFFKRLLHNKGSHLQRRMRQSAEAGGNYLKHSNNAVDTCIELKKFFDTEDKSIFADEELDGVREALKTLNDAKTGGLKGNFNLVYLSDTVFEEIQKANLISAGNRDIVQKMMSVVLKIKDKPQRENLLRKINFLVPNVSQPRVGIFSIGKRLFPRAETEKNQNNRAEFERMMNSTLHGIDYENKEEYTKDLLVFLKDKFPKVSDKNGETLSIPKSLENIINSPNGKVLSDSEKEKLQNYMLHLKRISAFENVLNTDALEKTELEVKGQKRSMLYLKSKIVGQMGLLYSLAFENGKNIGDIVDAKDKTYSYEQTNERVKSINNNAYLALEKEAKKLQVDDENLPFYISVLSMEHTANAFVTYYSEQGAATHNKETQEKIKEATALGSKLGQLKIMLIGKPGFIYKTNGDFVNSYEQSLSEIQDIQTDVDHLIGMKSFKDQMLEDHPDDPEDEKDAVELNEVDKEKQKIENNNRLLEQEIKDFSEIVMQKTSELNVFDDLDNAENLLNNLKKREELLTKETEKLKIQKPMSLTSASVAIKKFEERLLDEKNKTEEKQAEEKVKKEELEKKKEIKNLEDNLEKHYSRVKEIKDLVEEGLENAKAKELKKELNKMERAVLSIGEKLENLGVNKQLKVNHTLSLIKETRPRNKMFRSAKQVIKDYEEDKSKIIFDQYGNIATAV